MGINPSLSGENVGVIEPVIADSYSRNAGLALDADLTLMLRRGAYSLAFVLERGTAQARVWVETRGPRLTKDARSASGDLHVWQRTRGPRLRLERDLRVCEVRVLDFVLSNFFDSLHSSPYLL